MKAKIKEKWVAALRSGEYKQGLEQLKTKDDKYCCLGVLCDIHRKSMKQKSNKWDSLSYVTSTDKQSGIPPLSIVRWSGLEDQYGSFRYKNGKKTELTKLNDDGKSFKEIANIIEKYF